MKQVEFCLQSHTELLTDQEGKSGCRVVSEGEKGGLKAPGRPTFDTV